MTKFLSEYPNDESSAVEGGIVYAGMSPIEIPPDVRPRPETLAEAKKLADESALATAFTLGADAWVTFTKGEDGQ